MEILGDGFWPKVNKTAPGGCWLWVAGKTKLGYGAYSIGGFKAGMSYAHRLAYESLVGPIPTGKGIDHVCYSRACVNPAHMRLADRAENMRNRKKPSNNTSGFKGVSWDDEHQKWHACIGYEGRKINLGFFTSKEDAYEKYCWAARILHGDFANFGEAV